MEPQLRHEVDGDLAENYVAFTDQREGINQFEVYCSDCGKVLYTDEETSAKFAHAVELGGDNPFRCDDCTREDDELAHSAP